MAQQDHVVLAQPQDGGAHGGGFETARRRMVDDDLAGRGVRDPRVLAAMAAVPRERFVEPRHAAEAYADRPLPIGDGQTISQPLIVALMAEALALRPGDRVLEVGTGSGYAAAVLGLLAGEVHTVERHPALAATARARLAGLGYHRVHVHDGDGTRGWTAAAPYDAVLVSAGGALLPEPLVEQVGVGGRLIIPLGAEEGCQRLYRFRRLAAGRWARDDLGAVRFVPLVGAEALPARMSRSR
jgi:protein-L-isoaspartate(D-aspartate) O-methyltransferase